ncbi:MAG: ECF-type sigma factor [Gammaproteobacteria bacterium]|nr:ECF-type sigma factor [Gammaproteobacteria bacterium]MDH4315967.1 ECF-type sigma factor [Gammaproteobacteria bacterium]MDH5215385.1 ECF-type sigma factor [Gammaproteobacteria bacterium]
MSLTALIRSAVAGDADALSEVFSVAYEDLHRMAHARLKFQGRPATLNTTSLVHESYLRFANAGQLSIDDRAHFFRYASHVMRSVVVDVARASLSERRGGGAKAVTFNTNVADASAAGEEEILKIHEALDELATFDQRLVQVVEMRYFSGLTEREIAGILGVTDRTVRRDWEKARLLLARAIA